MEGGGNIGLKKFQQVLFATFLSFSHQPQKNRPSWRKISLNVYILTPLPRKASRFKEVLRMATPNQGRPFKGKYPVFSDRGIC